MNKYAIILAAGKGTRMKSLLDNKSKVSYEILGVPLVKHVLNALEPLKLDKIVTIVGFGGEITAQIVKDKSEIVWQKEQKGTGHAVMQTRPILEKEKGTTIILCGDTPLLKTSTLDLLLNKHLQEKNQLTILGAKVKNPQGYGRLLINSDNQLEKIIEQKDCNEEEKLIDVVNVGVYAFDNELLYKYLNYITPNNMAGEYYLTDLIEIFKTNGHRVGYSLVDKEEEMLGINDRAQLGIAAKIMQLNINNKHLLNGVTIIDPENTYIGPYVEIEPDTIIKPNTTILGITKIGQRNEIGPNSYISNTLIGNDNVVEMSKIVDSSLSNDVVVGPFANIKDNTDINNGVVVGNFVEIKNSVLKENVKAKHLSYIGDARVDRDSNIGAGAIFANYNGKNKNHTEIGKNVFIGSNVTLVAPIEIGDSSLVAAGSTITKNVSQSELAIARARQENKKKK